jgi:hypothetical protein
VADGQPAWQPRKDVLVEDPRNQAKSLVIPEFAGRINGRYARTLLPPVLEGEDSEEGYARGIAFRKEDCNDTTRVMYRLIHLCHSGRPRDAH